ncbi:MAG: Cof-type HAD-IIB family hydrolase [Pelosinus sp.]|nr:Cof-type HAD-IIB family hydrolase [Pelosinus sp.]
MTIKLVAVDMDDTLLDAKKAISPRTCAAIKQAVKQGVTVTIATGRMFASAMPYAKQLALDVPIITYNGALIRACLSGETFLHRPINNKVASGILALCREQNWYIQTYIDDVLYIKEHNDKSAYYEKAAGVKAVPVGDRFYAMTGQPLKMLIIEEPDKLQKIKNAIQSQFGDSISLTTSSPRYLEINQPGVNKGISLLYLAQKLQIERHEIMAIGDSQNDLDMIESAGFGVAMGNAAENIKKAAQAVTGGYDADGVAEAIEKYVLG